MKLPLKVELVEDWKQAFTYASWVLGIILALFGGAYAELDTVKDSLSPERFAQVVSVLGGLVAVLRVLRFSVNKALEELENDT